MEPCGAHLGSPLIWHMSKSRFLKKSTRWEGRKCDLGGSHPLVLALQLEAETETLHSASSNLLRRHVGAAGREHGHRALELWKESPPASEALSGGRSSPRRRSRSPHPAPLPTSWRGAAGQPSQRTTLACGVLLLHPVLPLRRPWVLLWWHRKEALPVLHQSLQARGWNRLGTQCG